MMSIAKMLWLIPTLLLIAAIGPINPKTGVPEWETVKRHCVYAENQEGTTYQGPCEEYQNYKTGEQRIMFKGRKFVIAEYEPPRHELPWMLLTINGQPAVAYQRHRSWTSYATLDFKHILDMCGEPDAIGGCE